MTITLNGEALDFSAEERQDALDSIQPYCARCGRCTDHVGEHEGSHMAGLVEYGTVMIDGTLYSDGTVSFTDAAYRLMEQGVDVRALSVNLDMMEYEAWERSEYIWRIADDGCGWVMKNDAYGCVDITRVA